MEVLHSRYHGRGTHGAKMENMKDGNILYKFLGLKEQNGKRTVRADFLDNQLFRFTQPSLLNDPFEMKPVIIMNKYSEEDYAVAREIATQYSGEYITRNFTHKDLETL